MAENNVKFYRLGYHNPVTLATYELYATGNNIVFAKVASGKGTWDTSDNTLDAPTYRIFAGGIHYNVADADALNYVMDQVNTWKGDVTDEGSILNIISKAVSAAQIVALVDTTSSNVSAEVVQVTDGDGTHDKIKLTAASSVVVTTGENAPENAGIVNPKNGDYYILEVAIYDSSVPSRTAYIYNGANSTWQALDGNVTAENVYFPEGLLRTAQFGFQPASMDIQTECEGMNLKDLLEWYLVEEKYPTVTLTQATAKAADYSINLATPANITTYVTGPSTGSLVEVGTLVAFNGITLTETASHTGLNSYNGTKGSITGMNYNYNENAVDGTLVEKLAYTTDTPTTNATYTTNFATANAQMTLTAAGFDGITTANASSGVEGGALTLSAQNGTTVEGENKLTLSWSNDASVTRTLTDQEGVDAYTAYPLSNKGNASANEHYTVNATSWSHTANAAVKTYATTTYTVNAVYPIYTNGVPVSNNYFNDKNKLNWSTNEFEIADASGNKTQVNGQKLELYNYKTTASKEYYIGTGNQNPTSGGQPFIIYTPSSAKIKSIEAGSFLESKGDWSGKTCLLDHSTGDDVYINGVLYNKWAGQGTFGAQHILVKLKLQ